MQQSSSHHNHIVAADLTKQIHLFSPASSSLNSDYKLLRSFCSRGSEQQQTSCVHGICFDDERSRIIACDSNNNRLSVWSADGSQFIKTINMPFSSTQRNPMSVCVDRYANCHRFLVGIEQSQILVFDAATTTRCFKQLDRKVNNLGNLRAILLECASTNSMAVCWPLIVTIIVSKCFEQPLCFSFIWLNFSFISYIRSLCFCFPFSESCSCNHFLLC